MILLMGIQLNPERMMVRFISSQTQFGLKYSDGAELLGIKMKQIRGLSEEPDQYIGWLNWGRWSGSDFIFF